MIKKHERPRRRAVPPACAGVAVLLATMGMHAVAGDAESSAERAAETLLYFDIPSQDLASALNQYAVTAGIQVVFAPELVRDLRSTALSGTYTRADAVRRLLAGTGLRLRFIGNDTYALEVDDVGPIGMRDGGNVELDEIVVVGTLLRNTAPTSPLITFGREDLKRGGYTTTQDVFARLPQNFSGITTSTGTQTGHYTTTQIDLRGMGSESTLTLVNGRRVSRAAGHEGRAVDIGMIPVSAIERIDILTDGASALYGSDAVAGVVNIVLRDDFEGAETTVQYGSSAAEVDNLLVSQTVGLSWGSGRLLATGQYDRRDALTSRSLGITTSDLRSRGGGDFRFFGIGAPGTVYPLGFFTGEPFTTITGPGGEPVYSIALPSGDGRNLGLDDGQLNGTTFIDVIPPMLAPEQENTSLYLTAEQDLGAVRLFLDALVSERVSRMTSMAPVAYLVVPPSNAFSPFAEPVLVGYQLNEFAAAPSKWTNTGWFVSTGARGSLGMGDWTWELAGTFSRDESDGESLAYDSAEMQARLASPDPAYAFNPFGDGSGQSPGVVEALYAARYSNGRTSADGAMLQMQGSLFDMPGGSARLALGAEYRREELVTSRGGEGIPTETRFADSHQEVSAVFAEAYLPLTGPNNARAGVRELALSVAGRYEDYNDFGDTFNPKIGLLWRPIEDLTLKANWGTSFRAPSLRELYYPASVNDTVSIFDPRAPGGPQNVFARLVLGGNPDLEPETADTISIAAEYRPAWMRGASLRVGFFRTDYEKRIRGAGDGLTQELLLQYEDSLPPGVIVRDSAGNLVQISTAYVNSARTRISGFDLSGGYSWEAGRWGMFDLTAAATITAAFDDQIVPDAPVDPQEGEVGSPPKWRGRLSLSWSLASWGASISVNHIDGLTLDDPDPRIVTRSVGSQTTTDVQVSYVPAGAGSGWLQGLSVRAGAQNVFDRPSPFVDGPFNLGIGQQNFMIEGRTLYLHLSKAFGSAVR